MQSKFELEFGDNLKDIFLDNEKSIGIAKNDGQAPSKESPLVIDIDLSSAMRKNGVARTGNGNEAVEMEKIVLKVLKTLLMQIGNARGRKYNLY